MTVCWAVTSFSTYLIYFYIKYVPGNIFLNNALASLAEPPSHFLSGYLLKKFRLKFALVFTYSCAIVFTVLIFYEATWLIVIAVFLAKFGSAASFNMVYLGNNELFPAIYLSTSFGVCNLTARVATILSPQVAEIAYPVPNIINTAAVATAIVCSLLIKMPDRPIEEEFATNEKKEEEEEEEIKKDYY